MTPIRVAILCVPAEERWPSMDIVGDKLIESLNRDTGGEVEATRIRPAMRTRFGRLPGLRSRSVARNADRLVHRYRDHPAYLRAEIRRRPFDLYHLADHSYSQLIHEVPAGRGIVTCHDLDTFRCLLHPDVEPRPAWFRGMTRRTLRGLQKAAFVSCDSDVTRNQLLEHELIPPERMETIPLGVHAECRPEDDPDASAELDRIFGPKPGPDAPELLHVGSNIPRKRVDVLLKAFAGVKAVHPHARLIKVGGVFEGELARLADELGVSSSTTTLAYAPSRIVSALYRRVDLVLQPSEAEGFGLPVAEALACGASLLASDLPVLREVGGSGAVYCPVGDVAGWSQVAVRMLRERRDGAPEVAARRRAGFEQVSAFTWTAHARRLAVIYRRILGATSG